MRKKIFILIISLVISSNAFANSQIEISGNKRIDIETIKVYGEIKSKQSYNSEDLDKILRNLYETNFFEDVNVTFDNNVLKITVKEYPVINKITIQGEKVSKFQKLIKDNILSKEKSSFIKSNIAKDSRTIKNLYEGLGFNTASIDTKMEQLNSDTINVFFIIDKGERVKIKSIKFIGDKKIRDRRLRDVIVSEEDKFWKIISKNTILNRNNIELDKRLLENYYKSTGYYDVQILSSSAKLDDKNLSILTYNINAGKRYRINKISTNVSPALDKKTFIPLEKNFKKLISEYYSPFKIKKLLEELDKLINFNDLQFVQHSVNEIIGDESIEIVLNIFEGEKNLIERINIIGNTVTNEDVIRSELLTDEGDPFNQLKLDRSISRLNARQIFSSVKQKVKTGSEKDLKIIDIIVEEQPTGEISAGAGVGTDGGLFSFGIKENNWLGTGVKVSSFVEIDETSVKGNIGFNNPNYNYSGNSLDFNLGAVTNDVPESGYENNLVSIGVGTEFEQYTNIFIRPGIEISSDELKVEESASSLLKKQAGTFNDITFNYSITRDERDRAFMPTSGYITSFGQEFPMYSDSAHIRNTLAISNYKSFGDNIVGSTKLYLAAINSLDEDVRLSRRIFIPYKRLRGFETRKIGPKDGKDYVGGNYASTLNLEANLPNLLPDSSNADISLFLDAGSIWGVDYDSSISGDTPKLRSSTGVSANWFSPIGPVTFTLAQNIAKASTDETQTFRFQLGTSF